MATIVTHNNFLSKKNDESFISISCKKMKKKIFEIIFWKSWNGGKFTELVSETKSQNKGDHEFWNHEMQGPPV